MDDDLSEEVAATDEVAETVESNPVADQQDAMAGANGSDESRLKTAGHQPLKSPGTAWRNGV